MDETTAPLFKQIAVLIQDSIVDGSLAAGERAPSTNELAAFHSINPATARKGLTILVEEGVLEKRRGLGMFVTEGAADLIRRRRREEFAAIFLAPLVDEAVKLDIPRAELHNLIDRVAESRGLYA
ncbi:GntR family transcriptional regulator [Corynebacterium pseudotuberculosis]|uniref:GntR family transcriptional regulator n=1 Tax=Corynebacterium pseudotuberculosis (strain C231) TaxID=681645 RepID=D9QD35_CORP2|nr:GntR family transcriptional regulator [Corynebacterium pseudotuberculosis]ADK29816.1 GntR family transcriptional regulator [Corynebacterium pseudotuberculosis FRC41]ADL11461.1 GntR family transcriptional regulator [Corynebacterium pseudotuberculosis C231]ADL21873.1 GntR family transcriptional regulator [Corynebacterium pseudotuberculosis 1002]ADO27271.1 GntR family transcriptional regulator [Corynebacterium pseudotuberculosis I19]AEK93332.1 GntR-family transcriptional regulator [Corynebacte